jgi:serine/threonine-protein kinase ATR
VIRDIINKPQKAQLLADLTEQSVRQLLILTEADTLPHLVLTKRRDIIEKIAQARKATVGEVLTQPRRNLAKILALLLCQPVTDLESSTMETLASVEPALREGSNNKLDALVNVDITGVAIEILMLAADQDNSKKKLVRHLHLTYHVLADQNSIIVGLQRWQCLLTRKVDNASPHRKRKISIHFVRRTSWVSSHTSQTS